jgi:hypothetical protein
VLITRPAAATWPVADAAFLELSTIYATTPSIIIQQSLAVRDTVDTLILIWAATAADEWKNRIVYLPV